MTAAWEKYLPIVDSCIPCLVDDERRLRAGLMLIRDIATNGQRRATDEAGEVLSCIVRQSGGAALAKLDPNDLQRVHRAMVKMLTCARDIQRVTQQDANHE